jgi:hypothetical protein
MAKDLHLTHIEDLILIHGIDGFEFIIETFNDLFDTLKSGTSKNKKDISTKWDGSPSIFCSSDFPKGEGPLVSTKGLFAKTPKAARSQEDIKKFFGNKPDLENKISTAFKLLKDFNIPSGELWDGDLLFTPDTLKTEIINDIRYITFQPNTILYAVDDNSDLAKTLKSSKMGIVWHKKYSGPSIQEADIIGFIKQTDLSSSKNIFQLTPEIQDISGKVTFTFEDSVSIFEALRKAQDEFHAIGDGFIESISGENNPISYALQVFQNFRIKTEGNQELKVKDFEKWLTSGANKMKKDDI